jgi:RimJ/RimL family protein N-acetyltransferase
MGGSYRMTLRDVTEDDLPILFEHQRDEESTRMAAVTVRDRQAFYAHWRKILADDGVVTQAVVVGGEVVGDVVCFEEGGERLVGYWIGRDHWGRGIATQALAQFLEQLPSRPLHAHVAKHNAGSIRVLEKCGFALVEERVAGGVEECVFSLAARGV